MKKIGLFGKVIPKEFEDKFKHIVKWLIANNCELYLQNDYYNVINNNSLLDGLTIHSFFSGYNDIPRDIDAVLCIGGDGTFLEAVSIIRNTAIPLIGINSGRLGFLANITAGEIEEALNQISNKQYSIEERTLVQFYAKNFSYPDYSFALNEFAIHKRDSFSMISINVFINNQYLNNYWADGLIISTPTGSTAYSLSVGGPILPPNTSCFVISPIAPHNLTVRPIVVPDDVEVKLVVESRTGNCFATLDHRSCLIDSGIEIIIKKADFKINTILLNNHSFFSTLRSKLMWGADKRNYND